MLIKISLLIKLLKSISFLTFLSAYCIIYWEKNAKSSTVIVHLSISPVEAVWLGAYKLKNIF